MGKGQVRSNQERRKPKAKTPIKAKASNLSRKSVAGNLADAA
jgi:hypothetical protein